VANIVFLTQINSVNRVTKLSVNINKIATLRNARGGSIPDVVQAAVNIQKFGADGITVHPRPDERHIKFSDVYALKPIVTTELNIEGYPLESFLKIVEDVLPAQVTLVPDPPDVLTSNAGWDTIKHQFMLKEIVARLKEKGMRVSLFMETNLKMIDAAKATGADRIELYTESYAANFSTDREFAIKDFRVAAIHASEIKIGLNAGHDLNLQNLQFFSSEIVGLLEVSIGHALISDALYFGLHNTVQMYKEKLNKKV
jgi:pyridoxine 5-phosphate synthase